MKKLVFLIIILFSSFYCGPKQEEVERIMEDGVEVVINHLEPYKIKGDPSTLLLEEEFTIDIERSEIVEIGLTDIWGIGIDSEGDIYLLNEMNRETFIFKFDRKGNFATSFGKKGQGPGEIQYPVSLHVIQDEIIISDITKVLFFSKNGNLLKQIPKDRNKRYVIPLRNKNYLVTERIIDETDFRTQHFGLILYDYNFNKIKEIIRTTLPNPYRGKGYRAVWAFFFASIYNEKIIEGNSERGYDIFVYDLDCNLLKKIRKEYIPVAVNKEDKKRILEKHKALPEEAKKKIYFPECFPPFQYLFTNDEGYLFVMTYEKGKKPREFIYDIFNSEGAFISRTCLDNYGQIGVSWDPLPVVAKNNKIYCLREKESGYKELVAYRMNWE